MKQRTNTTRNNMTIEQFYSQGWGPRMQCEYRGATYDIASVDFFECLVGLADSSSPLGINWVRCENITLKN